MGEVTFDDKLSARRVVNKDLSTQDMVRIKTLGRQVRSERQALEQIQRDFDQYAGQLGSDAAVRRGLIAWVLRDYETAGRELKSVGNKPDARFLLGLMAQERGDTDAARDQLAQASQQLSDPTPAQVELLTLLLKRGERDEAEKELANLEKRVQEHADVYFVRGLMLEQDLRLAEALTAYEAGLTLDPQHDRCRFRAALIYDQRGQEKTAMAYYVRCGRESGSYVGALVNLGLLYDEEDNYRQAMQCFNEVLRVEPNNERARLYLRNAEASLDMYYDEAQRKEQERLEQILRTPITDFEFSVRSRNCLAKMNIRTLGDLVQKTEAEMLGYKNFGETSLREIKEVLGQKGLRLGMRREDTDKGKSRERLKSLQQIGADSEMLMRPIGDLDLGVRSRKAMSQLDIRTIGDLVTHTEAELMAVKNFGMTSLVEIKQKLGEMNLSLKPMA